MAARTDEPKIALGVRFPESVHAYIQRSAKLADIDMSHTVRRMVALCMHEYPNHFSWLPYVEEEDDDEYEAA